MDLPDNIASLNLSNIVFLCGAGISYPPPTALPTVNKFVDAILTECGASSDIIQRVQQQIASNQVAARFEVLIDEIRKLQDKHLTVGRIFDSKGYNRNHHFLAEMLLRGVTVITTNFDTCIENALASHIEKIIFTGKDLKFLPTTTGILVKPHGSNSHDKANTNLVITIKALATTSQGFVRFPIWKEYLKELLCDKTVIVWGYSGSDEFDINPVILNSQPKHLFWIDYSSVHLLPAQVSTKNNKKVASLTKTLPITYLQGQFDKVADKWASQLGFKLATKKRRQELTVKGYIRLLFRSEGKKEALINLILHNYSLYKQVATRPLRVISTEIIIQKMKAHYRLGNPNKTEALFNKNRNRIKNKYHLILALYYYSASLYSLGRIKEAITTAKTHLKLSKQSKDTVLVIDSLNNLGGIYFAAGYYSQSETHYKKSLKENKLILSLEGQATAFWGLGDIECRKKRFTDAYSYYQKAQQIYAELGHAYCLAYMDLNMGVALSELEDFKKARHHLKVAEQTFYNLGDNQGMVYALNALSKLYYRQSKFHTCYISAIKAIKIIKNNPTLPSATETVLVFVGVFFKKGLKKSNLNKYIDMFKLLTEHRNDVFSNHLRKIVQSDFSAQNLKRIDSFFLKF